MAQEGNNANKPWRLIKKDQDYWILQAYHGTIVRNPYLSSGTDANRRIQWYDAKVSFRI